MSYVIGVDTGGTYTDSVLLECCDTDVFFVRKKAKDFTTKENLEKGISNSISRLNLTDDEKSNISKVVFSTTLATNAIVEGFKSRVGLIIIGEAPHGKLATECVEIVKGSINIKGRVLVNINREAIKRTVKEMARKVDAIAISGLASVRNPVQEQEVAQIVQEVCNLPVICGHELVEDLGFLERTNTAVINAGLLPIISNFVDAIKNVLREEKIDAPTFFVRGDGSITEMNVIQRKPVETVLSGPAASMIGAINLTDETDLIIADMGGTTTDTGLARKNRIELSKIGASVGGWLIKIKSANLCTFGLGGDSEITEVDGKIQVGPRRVLPACRGGEGNVTPTDILHYIGDFVEWNRADATKAIVLMAAKAGIEEELFVQQCVDAIIDKAYYYNEFIQKNLNIPLCAIGAPVCSWYKKVEDKYGVKLIVPENYSVANAVGSALAGVEETTTVTIRPGEEGYGYIVHSIVERLVFADKKEAINRGIEIARNYLAEQIRKQDLEIGEMKIICNDVFSGEDELIFDAIEINSDGFIDTEFGTIREDNYVETRITVRAKGNIFIEEK